MRRNYVPLAAFREKPVTLLVQRLALDNRHPWLTTVIHDRRLTAEGVCRPCEVTRPYKVRFDYWIGSTPVATILDPVPQPRLPGQRVIHTNQQNDKPCLFLPKTREWHGNQLLANTVVPWTLEWLLFYETWFVTGHWVAGGVLPSDFDAGAA